MPLTTRSELLTLNTSHRGAPFAFLEAKLFGTENLNLVVKARPFVGKGQGVSLGSITPLVSYKAQKFLYLEAKILNTKSLNLVRKAAPFVGILSTSIAPIITPGVGLLNIAYKAKPFCQVESKALNTNTLNIARIAQPFFVKGSVSTTTSPAITLLNATPISITILRGATQLFTVVDQSNTPISGVTVTSSNTGLGTVGATTNASGQVTLAASATAAGTFTLNFSYNNGSVTLTDMCTITVRSLGVISGNTMLEPLRAIVLKNGRKVQSVIGEEGLYKSLRLIAGRYTAGGSTGTVLVYEDGKVRPIKSNESADF